MFVKMYFDAIDSGLLAALGPRRWHTVCALARYMNADGLCYPSQARMGRDLGIHRQRVNERIKDILGFRFHDKPVVTMTQLHQPRGEKGRWAWNVYKIHPVSGLRIFVNDAPSTVSAKSDTGDPSNPVSEEPDTERFTVSAFTDTAKPDRTKIQNLNKTTSNVEDANPQARPTQSATASPLAIETRPRSPSDCERTSPEEVEARTLQVRSRLRDTGPSDLNIRRIVARMPWGEVEDGVLRAWSSYRDGRTQKPTAYFVGIISAPAPGSARRRA